MHLMAPPEVKAIFDEVRSEEINEAFEEGREAGLTPTQDEEAGPRHVDSR